MKSGENKTIKPVFKIMLICFSVSVLFVIAITAYFFLSGGLFGGGIKVYENRPPDTGNLPVAATLECEKYYWIDDSRGIDHAWYGFLFLTDAELSRLKEEYEWTKVDVYVEFEKEDYWLTTREKTEAELEFESKLGFNMYRHPVGDNSRERMLIPHDLTKPLEPYKEFDWRHNEAFSDEFTAPFTFGPAYLDVKNGIVYFYCYTM